MEQPNQATPNPLEAYKSEMGRLQSRINSLSSRLAHSSYYDSHKLFWENQLIRAEKERTAYDAYHDDVTGLLNRKGLYNALEALMAENGGTLANTLVLFLDADNFKPVNDTYGHAVGDEALATLARKAADKYPDAEEDSADTEASKATALWNRLRHRDASIEARYGGDEFVVVIPNQDPRDVEATLASFRARLHEINFVSQGQEISFGASVGSMFIDRLTDVETFKLSMDRLDKDMYQEKLRRKAAEKEVLAQEAARLAFAHLLDDEAA